MKQFSKKKFNQFVILIHLLVLGSVTTQQAFAVPPIQPQPQQPVAGNNAPQSNIYKIISDVTQILGNCSFGGGAIAGLACGSSIAGPILYAAGVGCYCASCISNRAANGNNQGAGQGAAANASAGAPAPVVVAAPSVPQVNAGAVALPPVGPSASDNLYNHTPSNSSGGAQPPSS